MTLPSSMRLKICARSRPVRGVSTNEPWDPAAGCRAGLGQQWFDVQTTVVKRGGQQRDVRPALAQGGLLLAPPAQHQLHRKGGLRAVVDGEDLRQQSGVVVGLEREPQTRRGLAGVPGPPTGRGDRVECGAGVAEEDFPSGRELDLTRGALKQPHAQLAFHVPDRPGQRRLRHAQPGGRTPKMQLLGDSHEVPELPDLQVTHIPTVSMAA
jgi:hypothetical protein